MAIKKLRYQKIEVSTGDIGLRKRIINRYRTIGNTDWFWDRETQDVRKGPPPKQLVVNHFEKEMLDDLLDGVTENDTIVESGISIAKGMKITHDQLIAWHNTAWRKVKKLVKS